MSDRIAVFNAGRVQQVGTAEELYDAPLTQFVAQFLGESNCWVGDVAHGPGRSTVSGPGWSVTGMTTTVTPGSGRAAVIVRPERCSLISRGTARADWNDVPCRIREIVYLGSLRKVIIDLEDGSTAVVSSQAGTEIQTEGSVSVAFPISSARTLPAG